MIFVGDEIEPSGFYVVASSQRCHCNVCVQIALCGGGGRVHLPLLSRSINSITLLLSRPPPVSPQLQSIHFPIFPSILIYPFYLPPVFVSSPRRLSLRAMSPGFLSPRRRRRRAGSASVRRSLMSQECADGSESFSFGAGRSRRLLCDSPPERQPPACRAHLMT